MRPRAIAVGSGEAVEVASADADSEILLNYSSVIHPSFGESDRPSRFSVGIPSRLATLGVALNKGEPDLGKDLKDSRNFKESMVCSRPQFSSLTFIVAHLSTFRPRKKGRGR